MPTKIADNVLSYASIIDDKTKEQAASLGRLPFVKPHIALMPDAHAGKGSAVGTVIPTVGAVIPAAVGVDIGCGMIAVETSLTAYSIEQLGGESALTALRDRIEETIPLSPGNYNSDFPYEFTRKRIAELEEIAQDRGINLSHSPKWREQLGSLGGGNHFIELSLDERDHVWCVLHSGSRGVGNKIAQKHIKIAQKLCTQWHIPLEDRDHAYIAQGAPEFRDYIRDLRWAQHFALLNREDMMDRFLLAVSEMTSLSADQIEVQRINCHHNYTEKTNIDGSNVWLTRKGAIDATEGKRGFIPGSMGTASYVVTGLGNNGALNSAPHGAGRLMSRTAAKHRFNVDDLDARMEGIVYRHGEEWIDEIPDAYKDIDQVIADSASLVSVDHKLRQILNVKGV